MIRIGRYAPLGIQPFNCRMTAVELRHHQVRQDKIFVASRYVTAARANFSFRTSEPVSWRTPAKPGEVVIVWAVGFGLPTATITAGSPIQVSSGPLAW